MSDVSKIAEVLAKHDLEHLVRSGAPSNEYEYEARLLLDYLATRGLLTAQHVRDVWLVCFYVDKKIGGIGRDHRHTLDIRIRDLPMRPEFQKIADEVNAIFRPTECNLEKSDPMPCAHCGLEKHGTTERATCLDADKAAFTSIAKHGPRVTHWRCRECKRCFTVERMVGPTEAQRVGS